MSASCGQEAFFEGHVHAFSVLGGVPTGQVPHERLVVVGAHPSGAGGVVGAGHLGERLGGAEVGEHSTVTIHASSLARGSGTYRTGVTCQAGLFPQLADGGGLPPPSASWGSVIGSAHPRWHPWWVLSWGGACRAWSLLVLVRLRWGW